MNIKALMNGTAFIPASVCSIEDEGSGGGEGGGSSADSGQDSGKAKDSTAEALEKEFVNDDGSESSSEAEGDGDGDGDDSGGESGEDEGSDGEAADGEESDEQEEEAKPEPKKNRAQERIDELTAARREAERERDLAHAEMRKAGLDPQNADAVTVEIPEEPDASKYEFGEHDLSYIKDRAAFDAKVEIATSQTKARFKAEAANLDAKWLKTQEAAYEKYPDFQEVVVDSSEGWDCPPVVAVGIKDSDYGADIAYELAKNKTEASRIAKLSPLEQAREFGRLEERFHQKATAPKEEPKDPAPAAIISKAPIPPKRRVGGGGGKFETPGDTNDFAAFDKMADKVLARQR